jgi:hypothetical protein
MGDTVLGPAWVAGDACYEIPEAFREITVIMDLRLG